MSNKERYAEWCKLNNIPIFSQNWWMDCICGEDNWDVYLVGNGMDIKASLVYYFDEITKEGASKKRIRRALLTQNNGIHIKYPANQGIVARQKYEEKIINEIIEYIESLDIVSYDQQYNWRFTNWLPFFWKYYHETTKYTYVIEDTEDIMKVRAEYSADARNMIKKAEKTVHIEKDNISLEDFYRVNKSSFDRQGVDIPYTFNQFASLYNSCNTNECVALLSAHDEQGNIHSVAMLVWDNSSVYFLLNGTDPEFKMSQSNYFLIDKCIELAHSMGKSFDFEGSVIKGVNHAFREFGGIPKAYFRIQKEY